MTYESVVKAAWATDPEFVEFCKAMYGPRASVADVVATERIAKMGPDVSSVHVPGNTDKKKKIRKQIDHIPEYERRYVRDDNGRFRSGRMVGGDAATAAGAGALSLYSGNAAANQFKALINEVKDNPKHRRALLKAISTKGGKGALLAALGGIAGAAASQNYKQAHNELKEQSGLERQHRRDLANTTRDLNFRELAGEHVDYEDVVTRRGNREARTHILAKSAEVTMGGALTDIDTDKRQVFGWASITKMDGVPVVDLQGDFIADDELEKAAYEYVHKSRIGGAMHYRVGEDGQIISKKDKPYHAADLIESFVVTDEKIEKMGLQSDKTGWWVGFQVNDPDVWDLVKSGEWKGFSIHGSGKRTATSMEELSINSAELGR